MSLRAEKTANSADFECMLAEETAEILAGLRETPKRISPKYFYDERGSELFDEICLLPEYYPTRTEHAIMQAHLPEIARFAGPGVSVIEFGAGSNAKARQLLSGLQAPAAYVPVEISGEYLAEQAAAIARAFPRVHVRPVVADFTKPFDLPRHSVEPNRNLVFMPGSTIGNFTRREAHALLEVMRYEARSGGALLIGVDLVKDIATVQAAYNDAKGITAAFNKNVLAHINAGVGADFHLENFRHEAVYDRTHDRIEMRLVSLKAHTVRLAGETVGFADGERIVTEYSHKYSIDGFRRLAEDAGWVPEACWTDAGALFSVHFFTTPAV